ncbi:hypothetical protein A4H97_11165 [Niastella yeongjuensis]|uniref:SusD/RagB family nutrient-binding outer membrane lipoprotein n=1 Tax=Niastella yeongjuensis TaxID=354355 RepID=A0A1V9EAS2_9BACT|nr:SusD/RagB family nutrient-binding outer membrane lipoprotein [Niastella yeongjuensis]OQP43189.1 hypothetical protein A4H97_11165 [Niastella yeongjuensis]
MKRIIVFLSIGLAALSFSACDKDYEKTNTDPIGIIRTSPDKLLSPALVNVLAANMGRNRSFNNELMQVTVTQSEDEFAIFRYDFRPSVADATWNAWYSELTNIRDIFSIASMPAYQNDSYKGISLVLEAWVFQLLTDTYGDVPYKDANKGMEGLVEPAFDKQKDIYLGLLEKLEQANTLLSTGTPIVATSDPLYHGDTNLWRKLSNSLRLRLLLRISGKSEVAAEVIEKIRQIAETPAEFPVFSSNEESAVFKWNGTIVTTDPLTNPFVTSLRELDFVIPSLCNFFIVRLHSWNDPRLDITTTYGNGTRNSLGIAQGPAGFAGIESGYAPGGGGETKQSYFYSYSNSDFSIQKNPLAGGTIMSYAELQFILAEAAAKGWITTGTAESYYYKGIAAGINFWVPKFPTDITNPAFTAYIAGAQGTEWNNTLPLDQATGDSKMERIHLQKYYSLFLNDFQQWFEYRRTGHPVLPKGAGLKNGGIMPARMNYPVYVQTTNPTNYGKAIINMGGDAINTQVWWQKP